MASVFQRVPPLHLLIAFESAARLGSFARAAEELSVTPSAVSHRIKNLEELWGEDLFVRSNAALRLTAAGTRYTSDPVAFSVFAEGLRPRPWLLAASGPGDLAADRKSTRLNSSHTDISRMPSSA